MAAHQIGKGVRWFGLPLMTGFLLTGIIAGPYALEFIAAPGVDRLRIIDKFALAFIAFAAGAELELEALRAYMGSIIAIIVGMTGVVFILGTLAFFLLADFMPFMHGLTTGGILGIAMLGGTLMVARSPSSAYAIIKELRARGPFTQIILGVTVLIDAVVIVLFALNVSAADMLIQGARFNAGLVLFLLAEIVLDVGIGILVAQVLRGILALPVHAHYKSALLLLAGYAIFALSAELHEVHLGPLPVRIFSEPLLIGLVAGFVVANYTRFAAEFRQQLEDISPGVLLCFFTLVGLSLEMDVIAQTWGIAVLLLLVRLVGIYLGSFVGSTVIGRTEHSPMYLGMTSITQAGVSIGLAKQVAVEFSPWGEDFASLTIAIIVINQLIGPPLFKWALSLVGEAHPRAEGHDFDGTRDVIIFGIDEQSLALARQFKNHNWEVKLADLEAGRINHLVWPGVEAHLLSALSLEELKVLQVDKADAIVAMLDDAANYTICELIYEHFGSTSMVALLRERTNLERFRELGVITVDPRTAVLDMLEHCVRSPSATALLLGREVNQDVIEITIGNPAYRGVALRDLHLPVDTLILSVRRGGQLVLSHGYTRLELGDEVTIVGAPQSLEELRWRFGPQ